MTKEQHEKNLKGEILQAIRKFEDNMVNADRRKSKDQANEDAKKIIAREIGACFVGQKNS